MTVHLLSTLLAASAVWAHPTPETNDIKPRAYATSINATNIALTSLGMFIVLAENTAECLTAASNTDGAAVEIAPCISGFAPQSWTVTASSIQVFDNMCLDVPGGSSANGTPLQIWTCAEGDTNQLWTQSPGNIIRWEGSCLDLTDGSAATGNIMQIWDCTGGPNQRWLLAPTTTMPGVPPTPMSIQADSNAAKCLTASSNTNGAAVEIEDCIAGSVYQSWIFSGSSIQIFHNTMCLDVTGGSTANGTPLQIWPCTEGDTNQMWTLFAGSILHWQASCLDLTDGSTADGNIMQIWDCTNGPNQQWTVTPAATTNQYIKPISDASKCLTAASNTDGAAVEIEDCVSGGSISQSWTIPSSEDSIQIFDSMCLDVTGGSSANGTPLQIWTCTEGDTNQLWTQSPGNVIRWEGSCLDLTDGNTTDGNIMQLWVCTGGPNQQWTIATGPAV